jgi:hypothetical protein
VDILVHYGENPWLQEYTGSTAADLTWRYDHDEVALKMEMAVLRSSQAEKELLPTSGRVFRLNTDLSSNDLGLLHVPNEAITSKSVAAEWKRLVQQRVSSTSEMTIQRPATIFFGKFVEDPTHSS